MTIEKNTMPNTPIVFNVALEPGLHANSSSIQNPLKQHLSQVIVEQLLYNKQNLVVQFET